MTYVTDVYELVRLNLIEGGLIPLTPTGGKVTNDEDRENCMKTNGELHGVTVTDYITQMAHELNERIDHQRRVLLEVVKEHENKGKPLSYCALVDCGPRRKYRQAVVNAVRVLEETRRAFKSKQLEELRKRLQALLAEDAGHEL